MISNPGPTYYKNRFFPQLFVAKIILVPSKTVNKQKEAGDGPFCEKTMKRYAVAKIRTNKSFKACHGTVDQCVPTILRHWVQIPTPTLFSLYN